MENNYTDQLAVMKAMASLYQKKAAVMQALEGGMVKTGENTHFKYKYVTASRIKHAVSRLLVENRLSLQMSGLNTENAVSVVEKKEGSTKEVPILRIQFQITLCDLDTGATESSFWFGEAQATDDKAASKCATSALKYYLISNLMIADKDEDRRDTDRGSRAQRPQGDAHISNPVLPPTKEDRAPVASKPQPPAWWGVLGEYQPFMEKSDFTDMRDAMSAGVKTGSLNITSDTEARAYIERTHGLFIDLDAKRAAAKDAS